METVLHACETFYVKYRIPLERILLVSWLLKDLAWMATIVVQGFCFGIVSILLHLYFLIADSRPAMRFHHASLFLWVIANFLWMTVEFTCINPSSHVHIGPDTPIGGITSHSQYLMVVIKHWLFFASVILQVILYGGLLYGWVPVPNPLPSSKSLLHSSSQSNDQAADDDDRVVEIELQSYAAVQADPVKAESPIEDDTERIVDIVPEDERFGFSMVLIENAYIIFWIFKDLFWSWSTGDFGVPFVVTMVCESLAIVCGTLACCCFLFVAYLYRNDRDGLLETLTSICWLNANLVWMMGEFFIRYDNMEFDDRTEQDDDSTRILSLVLFLGGLTIQGVLLLILIMEQKCNSTRWMLWKQEESVAGHSKGKRRYDTIGGALNVVASPMYTSGDDKAKGHDDSTPIPSSKPSIRLKGVPEESIGEVVEVPL